MRRLRTALTITTLACAGLASGAFASSADAARAPVLTGVCGTVKSRPASIDLAVDGSSFLAGNGVPVIKYDKLTATRFAPMHWASWTPDNARTIETEMVDNDRPSIGRGTLYGYTASIHLYRPINGLFTRMEIVTPSFAGFNRMYGTDYSSVQHYDASYCRGGGAGWTPVY